QELRTVANRTMRRRQRPASRRPADLGRDRGSAAVVVSLAPGPVGPNRRLPMRAGKSLAKKDVVRLATSVRTNKSISNPWTGKICAAWQKSFEGLLECGQLLITAKTKLPHGEFQNMIEGDLPFGTRTAQMLMRIGADHRLSNA